MKNLLRCLRSGRVCGAWLCGTTLALALLGVAANAWLASRDARARLDETLRAQQTILRQLDQREQERARQLAASLAQIEAWKKRVQTPQEVIRELPRSLPPLPQPIEIRLPDPAPTNPHDAEPALSGAEGPLRSEGEPPAVATIPQADLKPLFDFLQDCRACRVRIEAAEADLQDERARATALATQRDAAVQSARGEGFWKRTRRAAKWLVIGGALGAAAAAASR